jgi:outer membrane immunogenic protein
MIKRIIATACLSTCLGTIAQAADLTVIEAPAVAPVFNWTGFYAGVHGGYGWGRFEADDIGPQSDYSPDGWLGGGQIGFNYQFANQVVLGVEADAAFADLKDSATDRIDIFPPDIYVTVNAESKIDAFGTVRGRIGYAADRFLPYVTGGFAWANVTYSVDSTFVSGGTSTPNGGGSGSETATGWVLGGGLEYAITEHITAKAEYLYADLGSQNYGTAIDPIDADVIVQTAKAGLNYKF